MSRETTEQFVAEASQAGFGIPNDEGVCKFFDMGPGYAAAALFTWQAAVLSQELDPAMHEHARERDDYSGWVPDSGDPTRRFMARLTSCAAAIAEQPGQAGEATLAALDRMERSHEWLMVEGSDVSRVPALPLESVEIYGAIAESALSAEILSYLVAAISAFAAAERTEPAYIGCYSPHGPVWRSVDPGELDRCLLRAYLNDVPALQLSAVLVEAMPKRADGWLLANREVIASIAKELKAAPEPLPDPRTTFIEVMTASRPIVADFKPFTFTVAPPVDVASGGALLPILMDTPHGATLLGATPDSISDRLPFDVERPPWGYATANDQDAGQLEAIREPLSTVLTHALSAPRPRPSPSSATSAEDILH